MMGPIGVPDILAQARLGRAQTDLKRGLEQAQIEVVTGESAEPLKATGGDPARLFAMERSISTLDSRTPLLSMAKSRAAGMQTSLDSIQISTEQMGVKLLRDISVGDLSSARFTAKDAKTALGQVIGALNVELSGRHLFAGARSGAPLDTVDVLLADMETLFLPDPPATDPLTVAEIKTRVSNYFDPDSVDAMSFNARMWRGSDEKPPPVELADGEFLNYAVLGDDDALRDMMRGLALAATTVKTFNSGTDAEAITQMLEEAGGIIVKATDDITKLRSDLGLAESRIEAAQTRTAAQRATLELARADLIGVDQYEAATRVTQLQSQLEAIYAMTARSSQLSLLNFLR